MIDNEKQRTRFARWCATLTVSVMMLSGVLGGLPSVHAASGEGTVTVTVGTGGSNASDASYGGPGSLATLTVGTLTYLHFALTVGASHIAANQNNVTFQMNSNLFPTNSWDTAEESALSDLNAVGEWFVSYSDTSGVTDNSGISLVASEATSGGLITIQADQQMDATDIIHVYAVVKDVTYARAPADITIQTDDTGADSLANLASLPQVATSAADAGASVTLGANVMIGVAGTTTLTVTSPFALASGDAVYMQFPASINVENVGAAVTGTLEDSDSITCANPSSQVVRCDTTAPTNATGTIIMTGIVASYVSTADVSMVMVAYSANTSYVIAQDTSVAMTDTRPGSNNSTSSSASEVIYGLSVSSPEAGAAYVMNDEIEVEWESTGNGLMSNVNLSYSTDGGVTWHSIATNVQNTGSYIWTALDMDAQSVIVRVEGTDLVTTLASDSSDAFSIGMTDTSSDDTSDDLSDSSNNLLPEGTFMKGSSWDTVYYVDADGTRRPFLDRQTYFTYADDFEAVVTVDDSYLANFAIGTPMLPKAGVALVKIQSVNSVYAVTDDGTLRWLASESVASALYGSDWADYVIDVPVTAWGHFSFGEDVMSSDDLSVDRDVLETRDALNGK